MESRAMKLLDHVYESIVQYPTLYQTNSFELSRLRVLNQIFLVIGNGYEWANTRNPKHGGYLIEPKYRRLHGDWVPCIDKPYGKVRFEKPEIMPPIRERLWDEVYTWEPYPICHYSAIHELYTEDLFIQPDWLEGAVDIAKATRDFYLSEERTKHHCYPTELKARVDQQQIARAADISKLREMWGYSKSDEVPTLEEILIRKTESWNKHLTEQLDFVNNFLGKYETRI